MLHQMDTFSADLLCTPTYTQHYTSIQLPPYGNKEVSTDEWMDKWIKNM